MPDQIDNERLQELAHKWLNGTLTTDEQSEYNAWFNELNDEPLEVPSALAGDEAQLENNLFQKIQKEIKKSNPAKIRPLWTRIAAAASILLILSLGGYFVFHKQQPQQLAQVQKQDISPGGNKAILTLANGKKIVLTGAANGRIASQANVQVDKTADGKIQYAVNDNTTKEVAFNTLTTPRKGRYELQLADGTDVTIDASSSITYPVSFTGKDRQVSITGQVYFKVKHNAAHPFYVNTPKQKVEDIGTEFNISAYADEPVVATTLISGIVKVSADGQSKVLKPNEQAISANGLLKVSTVDVDGVTAWKNDYFDFDGSDLGAIMRQVSRWYDVDVVFENKELEKMQFGGTVSRFKNVSSVINKLELTKGVHFKLDGNKIYVTK